METKKNVKIHVCVFVLLILFHFIVTNELFSKISITSFVQTFVIHNVQSTQSVKVFKKIGDFKSQMKITKQQ